MISGWTTMPNLGSVMPEMGMKRTSSESAQPRGLATALFSITQQRVLGLLFGQPDRSFYANELISLTGGGSGAIQRELAKLEHSGLITSERRGSQKHYQANAASPLFDELCSIARKTFALVEPLREALDPLIPQIVAAFVYGSVAKREDRARSDIDLMVISDSLDFATLVSVLYPLEEKLGRPINPNIFDSKEFARKRHESGFLSRVIEQPKLWLIGGDNDLPT